MLRVAVAALCAPGAVAWLPALVQPARAQAKPSIVLILTDDQTVNTMSSMPHVRDQLVARGVKFTNSFVVNSLCCPSRASILTGQYSHSTGVYTNGPGDHGGFQAFRPHEGSTVATWLQSAGYRTALVGKYLNFYGDAGRAGYVPPGWNRWVAFAEDNGRYYDYHLSIDGRIHYYGNDPVDYSTDVLRRQAVRFIHGAHGPLFLYFAPFSPHGPATPAPRDANRFSHLAPYRPPNFNEKDVSDKPRWVRALPRLSSSKIERTDAARRRAFAALHSADDAVGAILRALRETGRIHHTLVVFMSDNGYAFGEHRWHYKMSPYEEAIRVPMVVRYDPLTSGGRQSRDLVLNIDLAPTFAQLGGAQPTTPVDGRSLLPVLRSAGATWRHDFLVEHIVTQLEQPYMPSYCAVRTRRYILVIYEYNTEPRYEYELYDLARDPYELVNRAGRAAYASVVQSLKDRLRTLCTPPPPGYTFPSG